MDDTKVFTVVILEDNGRFLLGRKKKGWGTGNWNGFGGKVESGETIKEAARREMEEESGLTVETLREMGVVRVSHTTRPKAEVHIFKAIGYTGTLIETDEMRPEWFSKDELPFQEMWSTDLYWMPLFLSEKIFDATFELDERDAVISRDVRIIEELKDAPSEFKFR